MSTVVTIYQPQYLPWLGLFDRIDRSDIFVILDTVAYSKNYFHNRNRIKTPNGWRWLTTPVLTKGKFGVNFKDLKVDFKQSWEKKHFKAICTYYGKAKFFDMYYDGFRKIYEVKYYNFMDVFKNTFFLIKKLLGFESNVIFASSLKVSGKKDRLLMNIIEAIGSDAYISGPDGRTYIDIKKWEENGIKIIFHDFAHPVYPQLYGSFIPQMSAIDLLFNCGPESLEVLRRKQKSVNLMLK